MLKLSDINISFGHKTIFKDASFEAHRGSITILQGKSGSGKSTLIDAILFRHPCQRSYEDKDLSHFTDDEVSDFLFRKVSAVYQEPLFADDLTIAENRDFLMKLYHAEDIRKDILHLFHLEDLLSKYPANLSGGEKTRCAVWLALIKQPDLLILDEPTASLNEENKEVMIRILKDYAQNHIVICSSHDQTLIDAGDVIYRIEAHKAVLYRTDEQAEIQPVQDNKQENDYRDYFTFIRREKKHHLFANLARIILPAGCMAFLFTSLSLNNVSLDRTKESLNGLSSEELLLYYELDGADYHDTGDDWISSYTYSNEEWPIPQEIVKKLYEIDNIAYITPRIDAGFYMMDSSQTEYSQEAYEEISKRSVWLYDQNQLIQELQYDEAKVSYFSAYTEEMLNRNRNAVIKEFGNHGVYITEHLYNELFKEHNPETPEIELYLPVPVYSTAGNAKLAHINPDGGDDIVVDANFIYGRFEKIRYPVRGIVKSQHSFGLSSYYETIFIPYDDWKNRIDALQSVPSTVPHRTRYGVLIQDPSTQTGVFEEYIDSLPDQYKDTEKYEQETGKIVSMTVCTDTLWTPCGYTAFVEDIARIHDTVYEIQQLGLTVANDYIDTSHIILVQESTRKTLTIISGLVTFIVLLGYLIIQYIRRDRTQTFRKYLSILGFRRKNREDFIRSKRIYNTTILTVITLLAYTVVRYILLHLHTAFISFDPKMYAGAALLCILCEYIYPLIIEKEKKA